MFSTSIVEHVQVLSLNCFVEKPKNNVRWQERGTKKHFVLGWDRLCQKKTQNKTPGHRRHDVSGLFAIYWSTCKQEYSSSCCVWKHLIGNTVLPRNTVLNAYEHAQCLVLWWCDHTTSQNTTECRVNKRNLELDWIYYSSFSPFLCLFLGIHLSSWIINVYFSLIRFAFDLFLY